MNGRLFKKMSNNVTVSNPPIVLFGKNLHVPVITLWLTWKRRRMQNYKGSG